jgi:hypothetical protein
MSEYTEQYKAVAKARHEAYTAFEGSDSIFFKWQRGQATAEEWLAAKTAIDEANPYPIKPTTTKKQTNVDADSNA